MLPYLAISLVITTANAEYYQSTEDKAASTDAGGKLIIKARSVNRETAGSSETSMGIEVDGGTEREAKSD